MGFGFFLKLKLTDLWSNNLFCRQLLMEHSVTCFARVFDAKKKSILDRFFCCGSEGIYVYSEKFGYLARYGSNTSSSSHKFFSRSECLLFGIIFIFKTSGFSLAGAADGEQFQSPPKMTGIFPVPLSVVRRKSKNAGSYLLGP